MCSEILQELEDAGVFLPRFAFLLDAWATTRKGPLLGLDINLDVDLGRIETGVTKPSSDSVDIYPGTKLMSTGGVPTA